MGMMSIEHITGRIKEADPTSPIAVFRGEVEPSGKLNATFGATVESRRRKKTGYYGFIGEWHSLSDLQEAIRTMRKVSKEKIAYYERNKEKDELQKNNLVTGDGGADSVATCGGS